VVGGLTLDLERSTKPLTLDSPATTP
jgi:hypothetical protein